MNKGLKHIMFLSGIALFLFTQVAFAQNENIVPQRDTLDLGEVISIGYRNLTLKDAYKLSTLPSVIDTAIEEVSPEFNVSPFVANTTFNVEPLKPARLKIVDPLNKYYRWYALAGFGLYTSPKAALYFNSLRSRVWNYGVEANHFSGNGGIKDVPSSAWGNSDVNLWINYFFKNYALSFKTGYQNNFVHYYGGLEGLDIIPLTADNTKQSVNRYNGDLYLKSHLKDIDDVNFESGLYFQHLSDNFETVEDRFVIDGNATKNFEDNFSLNVGFIYDYNKNNSIANHIISDSSDTDNNPRTQENSILVINTSVYFNLEKLKMRFGLDFAMDEGKIHLYPIIELKYPVIDQYFTPYIGINGKISRNLFSSFFDENPYVVSFAELKNTNQKFHFYGGLRGRISNRWSYDFTYSYESYQDYGLFVNDTLYSIQNRFNVIYDDIKLNRFYATISYRNSEKLKVSLAGNIYNYTTSEQLFAWHKPDVKVNLLVDYNLSNKFLIGFDLFYIGNRKAASFYPVEGIIPDQGIYVVDLDPYVDLNLKFEYQYNTRLSAFIEFNNLLSSNYQLWYKYQVQPFFALIGVTFSF